MILMVYFRTIASALSKGNLIGPEHYENITIAFMNVVGYTAFVTSFPSPEKVWYNFVMSPNFIHTMITSSNGNIFRATGPLCGEFTGDRWIPLTKTSDTELWCLIWSAPEQKMVQ